MTIFPHTLKQEQPYKLPIIDPHSALLLFFVLNFINKKTNPYPLTTNATTIPASLHPSPFLSKFNVAK
jgi:hypothetical protein